MRLGPGKHLKGRTLMGGIVKPEEFDYFHEVRHPLTQRRRPSDNPCFLHRLSSMLNSPASAAELSLTVFWLVSLLLCHRC
jgi:hypothetical protein